MTQPLDQAALDQLFGAARTHNAWQDRAISQETLHQLYDLLKWGPTSANCSPARFVFVQSPEGKEKLRPFLLPGNLAKTMSAPVTVIIANDYDFANHMDQLFPHMPAAKQWFAGEAMRTATAERNGSLQGAYLILAARALGLDCGPMSGFDQAGVDQAFFAGTNIKSNFLCNLGYGDPAGLFPRLPRLAFDQACQLV